MSKEEKNIVEGAIVKIERNRCIVDLDLGFTVSAVVKGKLRKCKISLAVGDRVTVELCEYDLSTGFLTRRL